eukprot:TRINITY_DN8270_c0_g2_i1.p1 TRINITY_DN8270_c0_g2~~TRINITY_DN8270_c0_g2_i1.p1  ORF type:complete len:358 (+),score=25.27 TRINITY_DN8270_c0_g2_i1:176-1249(+)
MFIFKLQAMENQSIFATSKIKFFKQFPRQHKFFGTGMFSHEKYNTKIKILSLKQTQQNNKNNSRASCIQKQNKERICQVFASQQIQISEEDSQVQQKHQHQQEESKLLSSIALFALPALGTCIADPLMSLVDTAFIARYSTLSALAALAPCSLVFSTITNLFSAYGAALTSSVSNHFGLGRHRQAYKELQQALTIGVSGGIVTAICGWMFAKQIIQITGANSQLIGMGVEYLKIRMIACPAVFCTMVANSFLYAQFDSFTALKLVILILVLNIFWDYVLVAKFNWGLQGAAYATVIATFVGLFFVLLILREKYVESQPAIFNNTQTQHGQNNSDTVNQGFLLSILFFVNLACFQLLL